MILATLFIFVLENENRNRDLGGVIFIMWPCSNWLIRCYIIIEEKVPVGEQLGEEKKCYHVVLYLGWTVIFFS